MVWCLIKQEKSYSSWRLRPSVPISYLISEIVEWNSIKLGTVGGGAEQGVYSTKLLGGFNFSQYQSNITLHEAQIETSIISQTSHLQCYQLCTKRFVHEINEYQSQ